jgi:CheY-like chemotaxis protein
MFIGIIEKSGNRMLNIINDIIDISKIEAGLMKTNFAESNINEQVEYIYTFFKPEVEAKGLSLTFRNSLPVKDSFILTDREKVYAILTNLVKNAIKYTEHGAIEFGYTVETTHALSVPAHALSLQFYVTDTGIGIPKDRQSAIFERFIQADIDDKMARSGAGLGLSISKAYTEMLGGEMWVESTIGEGSTFYFTLPYSVRQEESANPAGNSDKTGNSLSPKVSGLKVLIAEDDEVSELLLDLEVQAFSKEILKVKTGVEAVRLCRDIPDIDLILMDIRMPEMGGLSATRQIRQFNRDVIIIAQTAYSLAGDRERAIEAGCNEYISKPINKNELYSLVDRFFNS